MRQPLLFIIILFQFNTALYSQSKDTITFSKFIDSQDPKKSSDFIRFKEKDFVIPNCQTLLRNIFKTDSLVYKYSDNPNFHLDSNSSAFEFNNCNFRIPDTIKYLNCSESPSNVEWLLLNECTANFPFVIRVKRNNYFGQKSWLGDGNRAIVSIYKSNFKSLLIQDSKVQLSISNNTFSNKLIIENSEVKSCNISPKIGDNIDIEFVRDSIFETLSINNDYNDTILEKTSKKLSQITFKYCYINSYISVILKNKTSLLFEGCEFGPQAGLNLQVDTIEMKYCYKIAAPLYLGNNNNRLCIISLLQTNVSNLSNSFYFNNRLYFKDSIKYNYQDAVSSIYESLIEKYKRDGEMNSVKYLDVAYSRYKYEYKWYGGGILNFFDEIWWYYGYERWRCIYWSLFFLLLFYIVNAWNWKEISLVYKIVPVTQPSWFNKSKNLLTYRLRKQIHIFIFTALIFFSISFKFNNLSFKKTRWLVWFFVQYLVGLFCLFFIINAIFKF
jgi:hypothetical protein